MSLRKKRTERELVLGDYVTVHVPGVKVKPKGIVAVSDMLVQHEDFFQRVQKELGESNIAGQRVAA